MHKTYADLVRDALQVVSEISATEARKLLDEERSAIFLDVREPEETRRGAIPGSIVIPRGILEGHIEDVIPQRDTALVVVCAAGNRSALAGKTLLEMGYTNVQSLHGGFRAWAMGGHPVGPPAFA
jgi:rhodanese-related sulfurtransferase